MDRPKRRWFIVAGLALGIGLVLLARSILLPEKPENAPANVEVAQSAQQAPGHVPSPVAAPAPARETAPLKPEPEITGGALSGRVIDAATRVPVSIYKPGYEMVRERITYGSPITNMTTRLRQSSGVEVKAQATETGRPRRELFVIEMLGNGTRGIQLRVRLDENGVGSLPSALAGSTLNIHGSSATPAVIREWNAQPLDLKL